MSAPYLGDFPADQAVNFMWDSNDGDGASITRSADGTISIYKDNSDGSSYDQTQVTTGVTNDEDMDGLTGVHSCNITTTNEWYEIGHDYAVVLSASTIDGQTVNAVLATFSIENRCTDVNKWRGSVPAALTDTDKVQTSVQHKDANLDLTTIEQETIQSITGGGIK